MPTALILGISRKKATVAWCSAVFTATSFVGVLQRCSAVHCRLLVRCMHRTSRCADSIQRSDPAILFFVKVWQTSVWIHSRIHCFSSGLLLNLNPGSKSTSNSSTYTLCFLPSWSIFYIIRRGTSSNFTECHRFCEHRVPSMPQFSSAPGTIL